MAHNPNSEAGMGHGLPQAACTKTPLMIKSSRHTHTPPSLVPLGLAPPGLLDSVPTPCCAPTPWAPMHAPIPCAVLAGPSNPAMPCHARQMVPKHTLRIAPGLQCLPADGVCGVWHIQHAGVLPCPPPAVETASAGQRAAAWTGLPNTAAGVCAHGRMRKPLPVQGLRGLVTGD
jgi:hypothetical protein